MSDAEETTPPPTPSVESTFQYDWNGHIAEGLERLTELAARVHLDEDTHTTPRLLLGLFGFKKRGAMILEGLRAAANQLDIEIRPWLDTVGLDDGLEISKIVEAEQPDPERGVEAESAESSHEDETEYAGDMFKVGRLPSARAGIDQVSAGEPLSVAWSRMAFSGYSQLPVMRSSREVLGIISWSCLGRAMSRGVDVRPDALVTEYMAAAPQPGRTTDALMDVLSRVIEEEFVLVRDEHNKISGIITTTDISEFLQGRYQGFALLEQIERALRSWLQASLSTDQIKSARPTDSQFGDVQTVDDLVFSEYRTLFAGHWDALGSRLDRGDFLQRLQEVNRIRNDLMHFNGEEIEDEDHEALHHFLDGLKFLGRAE